MRRHALVLCAFAGITCAPTIEPPVTLQGKVLLDDVDGEQGHGGILVHLILGESFHASELTAPDGTFTFDDVSQVDYTLSLSKENYAPETAIPVLLKGSRHVINDGDDIKLKSLLTARFTAQLTSPDVDPNRGHSWLDVVSSALLTHESGQTIALLVQPDGSISIPGKLRPDTYQLVLSVAGHLPLSETARTVVLEDGDNDIGNIALIPQSQDASQAVTLSGHVNLTGLMDNSNVRVDVRRNDELFTTTLTDTNGTFALLTSGVPHSLKFSKEGFRSPENQPDEIDLIWVTDESEGEGGHFEVDGTRLNEVPFRLNPIPTATLTGIVASNALSNANDWPSRAFVTLTGEELQRIAPMSNNAQQGQGQFQFVAVPPGQYELAISARGHHPFSTDIDLPAGDFSLQEVSQDVEGPIVELVFIEEEDEQARQLSAKVLLAGRNPQDGDHSGILVEASVNNDLIRSALTNSQGRFILTLAPLDEVSLTFSKEGFVRPDDDIAVFWNEGQQRFERRGRPLSDFDEEGLTTLQPNRSARLTGTLNSPINDFDYDSVTGTLATANGEEVVEVDAQGQISLQDPVVPGLAVLEIDAQGHLPVAQAVLMETGDNPQGTIELIPEFEDPEVAITLAATVSLGQDDSSGVLIRALVGNTTVATAFSEENGTFSIRTLRDDHRLILSKEGFIDDEIPIAFSNDQQTFIFNGDPLLETTLITTLQPDRSAILTGTLSSPIDGFDFSDATIRFQSDIPLPQFDDVDPEDGTFTVTNLPLGLIGIEVRVDGHETHSQLVNLPQEDLQLELVPERVVMQGSVVHGEGESQIPVLGAQIHVRRQGQLIAAIATDDEGQFIFETLPLQHQLEISALGFDPIDSLTIDYNQGVSGFMNGVEPLVDTPIRLARSPFEGVIRVTVNVEPDWIPEEQRTVSVHLIGEGVESPVSSIGDGATHSFRGLSHGTYLLTASRSGFTADSRFVVLSAQDNDESETLSVTLQDLAAARLNLSGVIVPGDQLGELELRDANLSGANFAGQNLSGLDLSGANLTGADFRNANLSCVNADGVDMSGARLEGSLLARTSLRFANLQDARFDGAMLQVMEAEPNDQPEDAPDLRVLPVGVEGTLNPGDDEDWYALTLDGEATIDLYTRHRIGGEDVSTRILVCDDPLSCSNDEGEPLFQNDGEGSYAFLEEVALSAGTYYVVVASSDGGVGDYEIIVRGSNGELPATCERDTPELLEGASLSDASLVGTNLRSVNLQGVDLSHASLELAELQHANLTDVRLILTDLTDTDLRHAILQDTTLLNSIMLRTDARGASFEGASMTSSVVELADLSGANLRGANLNGANLVGANLAGADATGATMLGIVIGDSQEQPTVQPVDCNLSGVQGCTFDDLKNCSNDEDNCPDECQGPGIPRECSVTRVSLANAIFDEVEMSGVSLIHVDLRDTHFEGARLDRAIFSKCDYSEGTSFADASLIGADFQREDLARVGFQRALLMGAMLNNAGLVETNFTEANLQAAQIIAVGASVVFEGAYLNSVQMEGSSFIFGNFRNARIESAFLINANFGDADFRGAYFNHVRLSGSNFNLAKLNGLTFCEEGCWIDWDGVVWGDDTICPDGRRQAVFPLCGPPGLRP